MCALVTGVQTCALPIYLVLAPAVGEPHLDAAAAGAHVAGGGLDLVPGRRRQVQCWLVRLAHGRIVHARRESVTKVALAAQLLLQQLAVAQLRQFADVAGHARAGIDGVAGPAGHRSDIAYSAAADWRRAEEDTVDQGAGAVRAERE